MPQYVAPGVYVEEVPSGSRPIAGVGTSTAGFVGVVEDNVEMPPKPGSDQHYPVAPAKQAVLVTGWTEFVNNFGELSATNKDRNHVLAHAVYGFFNNGGTRCWVVRVPTPAPAPDKKSGDATATNTLDTALIDALTPLGRIDEIAIVAIPGATSQQVQEAILAHCETAKDRFAILDGRNAAASTKDAIRDGTRDSPDGAMYYPWIEVFDPATSATSQMPPSGHLAGVYARVDTLRGVHKAPANEVIRGALGVPVAVNRAEQAGLNPAGIDVIKAFDGTVTVWGARTLAGDQAPEWHYVNVRRLFLFLRESIVQGTQWVVFEPNDSSLWAKIVRNVTAFLTNVWRDGGLFGATPREAFYVKCDAETNPPEVRDLGQVVTEVGVALVRPAEFVVFRISQFTPQGG